jgi:hypothetical protein
VRAFGPDKKPQFLERPNDREVTSEVTAFYTGRMSTKNRWSKRISEADWADGQREKTMMKAIIHLSVIKSTMQQDARWHSS